MVFFLWERLPFHNTIWHVFVLAASFVLYAAVLVELSDRAPGALTAARPCRPAAAGPAQSSCCAALGRRP